VPRALEAVCLKAMARDPDARYADALDLASDVENWLGNEPVSAWREPWTERLTRVARRHRSWFAAGAIALLLITSCAVAAAVLINRERGKTNTALSESLRAQQREREAKLAVARQRDEAQRNFRLALEGTVSFKDLAEQLRPLAGTQAATVEKVLDQVTRNFEKMRAEVGDDPDLMTAQARMLNSFSELYIELGKTELSRARAGGAQALWETLLVQNAEDPTKRSELANALHNAANASTL
jgi:hypothetical protein